MRPAEPEYNQGLPDSPSRPSADILRLVAKNLAEMVMAYDMDRRLVFVNPAVETLTGYSVDELEKANFICWIHPEDQQRMLGFWEKLFDGSYYHDEEYRLITKDGRVKWVVSSWSPILDDTGRQVGVQGREFEITRRKLAETAARHSQEKLRADQERYRLLFENSPFPMWEEDFSEIRQYLNSLAATGVTDLRDHLSKHRSAVEECVRRVRILDVNRAAREFYGAATKEELLGGLSRIFDERAFEVFREELATLVENGKSFRTEFQVHKLDGEERLVDMVVSIVDSAREDWSRVIVSFFDVTDRKRLEEQVVQSQKMESLGRLAGGIAHDFNNLLTVINGYSDWILSDMDAANPFRNRLEAVRDAGERCAELTSQLLAFSRKHVVQTGPLDLNRLIHETHSVLDRILGDDIRVQAQLAPDLYPIEADRGQIHQVLMNLAANAREAMPDGGALSITTRNLENEGTVLLEVRDTGHGMDDCTRRHLFEPFFSTRKDTRNTGLGLAIVFGIVNQSGGRIEVESAPGEGACFRIYLVRSQRRIETAAPLEPAKRAVGEGSVVLVVDDREDVRVLACRMLEELGYRTLAADGGLEALAIAGSFKGAIPVLLTDVVMPGMNGRELSNQLQRVNPQIRTIFMSGYTDRLLQNEAGPGFSQFLQKPFTLAQLARELDAIQAFPLPDGVPEDTQ